MGILTVCLFNFIICLSGNEIVSNLALQMSLYFNVYFSPFWYTTCIVMLVAKVITALVPLIVIHTVGLDYDLPHP